MQTTFTIYREDSYGDSFEIELTLDWSYSPGCRGHRDRYGAPEEPDEPPSLELQSAISADGHDWVGDLSDREVEEAETAAWREHERTQP